MSLHASDEMECAVRKEKIENKFFQSRDLCLRALTQTRHAQKRAQK